MLTPRALLAPHFPTLLEDEHRRHHTPMLEALAREARRLAAELPDVVVVVSASWKTTGPFQVGTGRFHRTRTDDPGFGVEARYDCNGHPELARALVDAGVRAGMHVGAAERGVDAGVAVPMHFLSPAHGPRIVPLSVARRPAEECRGWGAVIRRVLEPRPERIALVVGGMLSHATHAWNFRRDVPEADQLDTTVLQALTTGDWDAIARAAERWATQAQPEAGLRHLEVLRGFLGSDLPAEILCYEAAPGMGSALVAFAVPGAVSVAPPEEPAEIVAAPARQAPNPARDARGDAPARESLPAPRPVRDARGGAPARGPRPFPRPARDARGGAPARGPRPFPRPARDARGGAPARGPRPFPRPARDARGGAPARGPRPFPRPARDTRGGAPARGPRPFPRPARDDRGSAPARGPRPFPRPARDARGGAPARGPRPVRDAAGGAPSRERRGPPRGRPGQPAGPRRVSAGSRTPKPRGRAPGSRPARRPRD